MNEWRNKIMYVKIVLVYNVTAIDPRVSNMSFRTDLGAIVIKEV